MKIEANNICDETKKSPSVEEVSTIIQKLMKEKIVMVFNHLTQVLNLIKINKKEKIL